MATARSVLVLAAGLLASLGVPALAAQPPRAVPGSDGGYIVLLVGSAVDADDATADLERRRSFRARHRFRRAVRGFSARLSDAQAARLREDPEVASVTPDRPVEASGEVNLLSAGTVPAGVRRIGAGAVSKTRQASSANVAVMDSGIDLSHPDLNASDGVNCVSPGTPAQDEDGHGTHVAGTIAARNDGRGVVGVAPATDLYAVKVLGADGKGTVSQLLCGIDWITATRSDSDPSNDISVANVSLGGAGDPVRSCARTTDPLHRAICASTRAGVTYVVAAGNDGWDFDSARAPDLPAAYPEVLAVTAMSDSDGVPGAAGGGPGCLTGEGDDRYASFSNYAATSGGAAHTVAAPGVCVRSTWPGGGYATVSGTSMAAPHLAGAVALCLGEEGAAGDCSGLAPGEIVARMVQSARGRALDAPGSGFSGDPSCAIPGRHIGHLAWSALPGGTASAEASPSRSASCQVPVAPAVPAPAAAPRPTAASPPADRVAPVPAISIARQRLARVLRRGLRVSLRCSEACLAAAEVWLPGSTAKRVRLSRGTTARIARRSALVLSAGARKSVVLKLSRTARRRLARVGRVTLKVQMVARDAAGNRPSASRRVTIRR